MVMRSLGIDATNVGLGGGTTHLVEILKHFSLKNNNFLKIYVFSSDKVLNQIDDFEALVKIRSPYLNGSLLKRIFFQFFIFDKLLFKNCDILFSITGDYIGSFRPIVGMSRNMLLYDKKIVSEINSLSQKIKFKLSFYRQKRSFENSIGVIFISKIARELGSKLIDLNSKNISLIHHGISTKFSNSPKDQRSIEDYSYTNPFQFLYVSTIHMYKHQWNVIKAIGDLRDEGYPIALVLVGGSIFSPAEILLTKTLKQVDPKGEFVNWKGHIDYSEIQNIYKNIDGIIYASTCENMPNILLESMSSGTAIACSQTQPMPEFLKNSGFYFDSYSIESIKKALVFMLNHPEIRKQYIFDNQKQVKEYSWDKTSNETFDFILSCFHKFNNNVQE